jgi:hypothetical protein
MMAKLLADLKIGTLLIFDTINQANKLQLMKSISQVTNLRGENRGLFLIVT